MKIPWYKRYLSYFSDIHIESRQGNVNPELHLFLVKGRFQLCTPKAIYSFADLYDNFSHAFTLLKWDMLQGKDALLLGFGLGSIPYMLERKFKKFLEYTAVEPDLEVIDMASTYVLDDLSSRIQFYTCDAYGFMERNSQTFDLICMDVFEEDQIPEQFLGREFQEYLKKALNPQGVLLFNCLYKTAEDKQGTDRFFTEVFRPVFHEAFAFKARGNLMLTNDGRYFHRD